MRVYKFPLDTTVEMPRGAGVLSVGEQGNRLMVWAAVDEKENRFVTRRFMIVGTGHDWPQTHSIKFIGTVHAFNGVLVMHVFEITDG